MTPTNERERIAALRERQQQYYDSIRTLLHSLADVDVELILQDGELYLLYDWLNADGTFTQRRQLVGKRVQRIGAAAQATSGC